MLSLRLCGAGLALAMVLASPALRAEEIGRVDTAFNWVGANKHIAVEAFDDPKVAGVTCYLSMARKGGISGAIGVAEETSDASIACRQVGPISFRKPISADEEGEEVFRESRSFWFKKLQVVRFWDAKRKVLVYLTYSDKLIDGSPKNAVTAVALMPWGSEPPGEVRIER
ncbi:MAG: CreA family protein [Alphaproteobacteria bacterium]|nr:CreA family protein [Alphaproteobacteria bacterium]MCB9930267.1 CreA family protein [Alphaproteobacteria bacterium]